MEKPRAGQGLRPGPPRVLIYLVTLDGRTAGGSRGPPAGRVTLRKLPLAQRFASLGEGAAEGLAGVRHSSSRFPSEHRRTE